MIFGLQSYILIIGIIHVLSQYSRKELTSNDIINEKVNRTIDLTENIITVKTEVLIKSNKNDALTAYRHLILKNNSLSLIHISAELKSTSGEESINLKIIEKSSDSKLFNFYDLTFNTEPMNYEEERVLVLNEHYFGRLDLLPKAIDIKGDQNVVLSDSINFVSFYMTMDQVSTLKFEKRTKFM